MNAWNSKTTIFRFLSVLGCVVCFAVELQAQGVSGKEVGKDAGIIVLVRTVWLGSWRDFYLETSQLKSLPSWEGGERDLPTDFTAALRSANEWIVSEEGNVATGPTYRWEFAHAELKRIRGAHWVWIVTYQGKSTAIGGTGQPPLACVCILMDGKVASVRATAMRANIAVRVEDFPDLPQEAVVVARQSIRVMDGMAEFGFPFMIYNDLPVELRRSLPQSFRDTWSTPLVETPGR